MGNAGYSGKEGKSEEGGLLELLSRAIADSERGLGNDKLLDTITREYYKIKLEAVRRRTAEDHEITAAFVSLNAGLKGYRALASGYWFTRLFFFMRHRKTIAAFLMQEYGRVESNRKLVEETVREELELTRQERGMNCPRDEQLEAIRGELMAAYSQRLQNAANYLAALRDGWQHFYPQKPFPRDGLK